VRAFGVWAAVAAILFPAAAAADDDPSPEQACHFGAYRLPDGGLLTLAPSDPPNLRYRLRDGTAGKLWPAPGGGFEGGDGWSVRTPVTVRAQFGPCGADRFTRQKGDGPAVEAQRVPLPVEPITFASGKERLYGELVLPERGAPKAIVVLQYGSGSDSAVLNNYVQYMLPLDGIAVFVFDKRGTGRSGGGRTMDFHQMARDMAAAVDAIRDRPQAKGVPLGLMGESQGGWVAPLAATLRKVDFVVASYSLAVSPVGEDRDEVAQSVQAYGPKALAQANTLHLAAMRIANSHFREGQVEFERLKALYRDEPWFKDVGGDFTGTLAATPPEKLGEIKAMFDFPYDLEYEPEPVLARLKTPMLWVLAGRDTEAPHESTLAVLRRLQARRSPIDVAVFPNADHAMIEVAPGPDGKPKAVGRLSPGYFDLLADWIVRRRLEGPYGAATLIPRRYSSSGTP
jgi:pimeloyl-ACP methyl ester carboxylesterase